MPRRKAKKYNQEELSRRLKISLLGIFAFIFIGVVLLNFYGPQIGALFGFISVNRNVEGPSAQVNLTPPSFADLPEASKEESINIQGYAPPGSNVRIFVNGPEKGTALTSGDGQFIFEDIPLITGRNTIFARSYDDKGNESEKSETHIITVDEEKPEIKIEEPQNGATIKNLNERVMIRGEVNERSRIRINGNLVVLKPNLTFEYLLGVSEGDVKITVEATDEAGNSEVEIIDVKYERDSG